MWKSPFADNVMPDVDDPRYKPVNPGSMMDCSIRIVDLKEQDNGPWICTPFIDSSSLVPESSPVNVIVARK